MKRLVGWLRSPKFFWVVVGLFVLQGVLFAAIVRPSHQNVKSDGYVTRDGGVIPDGNRHLGAIYYFAERPILSTPYINEIDSRDIWMGEIERFPSYLYYYTMSWPTRLALSMGASDTFIVMMVRLLGVLMGVGVLVLLRKILNTIQDSQVVTSLSLLAMSLTGAFVWMSAAENYDVMSLLVFMAFMYSSIKLFTKKDTTQLPWMMLWAFMVSITKYTYTPFVAVLSIVAIGILVYNARGVVKTWALVKNQLGAKFSAKPVATGLLVVAVVVFGFLSIERLGVNLVQYGEPDPTCNLVHSTEDCMKFGVFSRNYNRSVSYAEQLASGEVEPTTWQPIEYTKYWVWRYYSSIYGYVGHIWIYDFWPAMLAGGWAMIGLVLVLLAFWTRWRPRIFKSTAFRYVMLATALIIVIQYAFNLNTIITYGGSAYGHQGRYLLAALPFLYVLAASLAASVWHKLPSSRKNYFLPVVLLVLAIGVVHSAPVSFFVHATSDAWFSDLWLRLTS